MTIKFIQHGSADYEETVALRTDILQRPLGLPVLDAETLGREASQYHMACYDGDRLVGCLVLTPLGDGELKMRQVAVAESEQRRGVGKAMVAASERFAREAGFALISLHARESAAPFYDRLGYDRVGEQFEEVSIPHWRMVKRVAGSQ